MAVAVGVQINGPTERRESTTAKTVHQGDQRRPKIAIYMDSNSKFINFHKLFPNHQIIFSRCGTIQSARETITRQRLYGVTDVILHVGTNDIETTLHEEVSGNLEL